MRSNRIDKENSNKKNIIFLWANEDSKAIEILSSLSNGYTSFNVCKKISYLSLSYDKNCDTSVKERINVNNINLYNNIDVKLIKMKTIVEKHQQVIDYIIKNRKSPSHNNKDIDIRRIGRLLDTYKQKRKIKKNDKIEKLYNDNNLFNYLNIRFKDDRTMLEKFEELVQWINDNDMEIPSTHSKNDDEKKLGRLLDGYKSYKRIKYPEINKLLKQNNLLCILDKKNNRKN